MLVIMIVPGSIASLEACEHGFKLADDGSFFAVPRSLQSDRHLLQGVGMSVPVFIAHDGSPGGVPG